MKQLSSSELNHLSKEDMAAMILQLQHQNAVLMERLAVSDARRFGRKTEKLDTLPGQLKLFNEAEDAADETVAEPEIETVVIRRKKTAGKRRDDLSGLPVRIENHELSEQELTDIFGANGWKRLPDEVYSRLEYQPAVHEVVEHHVAVYAGKKKDQMIRAHRPTDLLRNSVATPSLVAAIMNGKYTNAMPLYRISQELERNNVILSRATMANWMIRCSERYLSLVYDRLHQYLCQQSVLQADETSVEVTKDGRSAGSKSYMFVYRTSELLPDKPVILYKYEKTRGHTHAAEFLKGFSGTLVSDAFSGYKALEREEKTIQAAFCWAHARRDFTDALKALKGPAKKHAKKSVAHKALQLIARIYAADGKLKHLSSKERYIRRQNEVLPLVEAYFAWVKQQDIPSILSEKTREGLKYSINHEKYLLRFLTDGNIPIDNSATERAIRPFTIGRANWRLIDTVHGAQASAVIYSLIETAKANNLKVYEYLKHLLTEIPKFMDGTSLDFLDTLMPWSDNLPDICRKTK